MLIFLSSSKEHETFSARPKSYPPLFQSAKWYNAWVIVNRQSVQKQRSNEDCEAHIGKKKDLSKPIYYFSYFLEGKKSVICFYLFIFKSLLKELWCQTAWVQPLVLPFGCRSLDRFLKHPSSYRVVLRLK